MVRPDQRPKNLDIHVNKYGKFGIAFSKDFITKNGGIPVHYIPTQAKESSFINKGQFYDIKAKEFLNYYDIIQKSKSDDLIDMITEIQNFLSYHIFAYTKFFDHGLSDDEPKNYYFEREWRILGNLKFNIYDIGVFT